ncbi:MAG: hypothetical protein JEY94_06820 [Melioribacteraceae bacterium]|nr:hypothetical protein [Melioribacteraceae bacterium]
MLKKYETEIKIIDQVYGEVVEAITNAPDSSDFEASRIYFENAKARMNDWARKLVKVKDELESKEDVQDLTADNRPA